MSNKPQGQLNIFNVIFILSLVFIIINIAFVFDVGRSLLEIIVQFLLFLFVLNILLEFLKECFRIACNLYKKLF